MWAPQHYISEGIARGHDEQLLCDAVEQIERVELLNCPLPAILSLKHLSLRAEVPYGILRSVVEREWCESYRQFSIKKRSGGRRFINVPAPKLMCVQKWVNEYILKNVKPHEASFAFHPGSSIVKCAARHAGAKWLVKLDVSNFFESISEVQVFRVFKGLGYEPLVAFELARICTKNSGELFSRQQYPNWLIRKRNNNIEAYSGRELGHLPQGAPTSPMLSNLIMFESDKRLAALASDIGLVYTRYSDDFAFSTRDKNFGRKRARDLIFNVEKELCSIGFRPHYRKTKVIPPGAKKIVLGLQVDGDNPRLSREFKSNIRMHLYYLEKHGALEHAKKRNFDSAVSSFYCNNSCIAS